MPSAHKGTPITVRVDGTDLALWEALKARHGGPKRAFVAILRAGSERNEQADDIDLAAELERLAKHVRDRASPAKPAAAIATPPAEPKRSRFAGAPTPSTDKPPGNT